MDVKGVTAVFPYHAAAPMDFDASASSSMGLLHGDQIGSGGIANRATGTNNAFQVR